MGLQQIADFLTGKNRSQEQDKYNQYWNKVREDKAAGNPVFETKNPNKKQVNNYLGITPSPKMGLGKIIDDLFHPIHSPISENNSLDGIKNKLSPTPTVTPTLFPTMTPNPSPTPIQGLHSTTQNKDTDNFLSSVIYPLSKELGVHPSVSAGQYGMEGRLGGVGAERNNFYNLGITDQMVNSKDYTNAPKFDSPEEGVKAYLRYITGQATDSFYANGIDGSKTGKLGKKQFQELYKKYKDNPEAFLKAIGPTYSSSGDLYAQNVMNVPEYRDYLNK